ncbi:SDR family oxidoreductase [Clostridium bovifaecis]|uniref:SDR family oxidoreductase n=1 Tax=Clostridium bovifaecis TaxID=2184719 RepID=A0A6I6F2F5_9CLOT|nr:SDR family oxidoreductase [Clostridium bovifaecis]
MARDSVLHRAQEPDDIAYAVLFLASDEAKNITGQSLNVDSGKILR